ncbi:ubiquitin conjugating enzyme E2 [Acrasis kona]|uniref:E2 ubiquitin-conjugating enzyme n=1 Tax=Acrasis kona TaxID=1008807 RepID=A0AAW2Z6N3_9EUKA
MSFLSPKVVQRIGKEIISLHKDKIDGIDVLCENDLDNISEISAVIHGPQGTPFEGGQFTIKLSFCEEFPNKPPKGYFVTKIFHPNVSREGEICVNTLKRDWKSTNTLRHVLLVIRCLLIEPNPDSALNADAGRLIQENYEVYANKAKMMTGIYAKRKELNSAQVQEEETKENNMNSSNVVPAQNGVAGKTPSTATVVKKPTLTATTTKDKKKTLKRL